MAKDTPKSGNEAVGSEGSANGVALDLNPFDTPEIRERHRERKEAEDAAEAAAVSIVSGRYAATVGVGLSQAARACLARLAGVRVADLAKVGVLSGTPPTKADVDAWHAQRKLTWNPPNDASPLADVRVAVGGIDPKARCALADVVRAADDGHRWAEAVVEEARAENSYAVVVGDRKKRPVSFTTAELYARGAPLDAVKALPDEMTLARGQSARIVRAWDSEERLRADELARSIETAKAVAAIKIPQRINLATYTPLDTGLVRGRTGARQRQPGSVR
ncbi:hypothetical protein VIMS_02853 [Mycobacterium marinum]|uniref:hypothetical protein n=1 Tax=Mycobacterium marinum TaxID=1781 RepID=UPI000E3BADE6|nr:hypothetical protein [Mycobacterium marinum]RFZ13755.1 hypothetical protein VIMS_02853 [Mycobacterium marinum]